MQGCDFQTSLSIQPSAKEKLTTHDKISISQEVDVVPREHLRKFQVIISKTNSVAEDDTYRAWSDQEPGLVSRTNLGRLRTQIFMVKRQALPTELSSLSSFFLISQPSLLSPSLSFNPLCPFSFFLPLRHIPGLLEVL